MKWSDDEVENAPLHELRFMVDEIDYQSIMWAIAKRETLRDTGALIIADGKGDLGGRLLGLICRDWLDVVRVREQGADTVDK